MDLKEIRIWNIKFNLLTVQEISEIVENWLQEGRRGIHITGVSASVVSRAQEDDFLRHAILDSDIVNVDSFLPAYFIHKKGYSFKKRTSSPDVLEEFFRVANEKKRKVFLFGATDATLQTLHSVLKKEYPDMEIVGMRNGFYAEEEEETIASAISDLNPDYIFIAMPSPQKERFILKNKGKINAGVFYGVGGAFEAKAGVMKRPPKFLRGHGLEGLFRMLRKPKVYAARIPLLLDFIRLAREN